MRTHLLVLFILFPIPTAISQNTSTRLSGMGNLSIAVVDTESEAFANPAKASWIGTGLVRLNPYYFGASNDFSENQYPGTSGNAPSTTSSSISNTQYGMPIGIIIPVSSFRLGAAASAQRMTNHQEDNSWTGGTYPSSTKSTYDTKSPLTSLDLLASVDFGWGSVGGIGSWSGSKTENGSRTEYPTSSPATYYETLYTDNESDHSYGLGALFGSMQTAQISFTMTMEGYHEESKPTRAVYSGVVQDLSQPDVGLTAGTNTRLMGEVRKSYAGNILAGVTISYSNASVDQSEKYTWYDMGVYVPTYEERKTGRSSIDEYRFGAGLSKSIEGGGLFSIEYVYEPYKSHDESYHTSGGIYPDGRLYNYGDVSSTNETKATIQEIRIGAEIEITPELTARGGLEVMWVNYGYNSRSAYYSETSDLNGATDATYYGAGGFSYSLGSIRIDYSFGMVPYDWSSLQYGIQSRDIVLQHSATVSFQF